eukprot:TRINITY_DN1740_c0_g1_i2.p1 TRINITY_DN1740_c0_g1~~TRINITY_DN1740_c0_g1_i2.p1  ORF type:complete len:229 (-),score=31.12 TRINITY_DN1740_c0_g1_i2:1323-1958(-)
MRALAVPPLVLLCASIARQSHSLVLSAIAPREVSARYSRQTILASTAVPYVPPSGDDGWTGEGASGGGEEVAAVKSQLLQLSAITDRGQQASDLQKDDVELLVTRLQELVPAEEPFNGDDMLGSWTLVYSSGEVFRGDPVFAHIQALAGNPLWPNRVYRMAGAMPTARVGTVQQTIATGGEEGRCTLKSRVEVKVRAGCVLGIGARSSQVR